MIEAADPTEDEREAIHEVERGTEWDHRPHGLLVAFHHAVGTAVAHYGAAEEALEADHPGLASRFESEVLPATATEEGHLSYGLVAEFEAGALATVDDAAERTREELVDVERYVVEAAGRGGPGEADREVRSSTDDAGRAGGGGEGS